MQKENTSNNLQPIEIHTVKTPDIIKVSNNSANKCFYNSYMVAKENEDVEIIEGIGLIVGKNDTAKAIAHAWNKKDDIYFDVTIEDPAVNSSDVKKLKYLKLRSYHPDKFKNQNKLEFDDITNQMVKEMNENLNQ